MLRLCRRLEIYATFQSFFEINILWKNKLLSWKVIFATFHVDIIGQLKTAQRYH